MKAEASLKYKHRSDAREVYKKRKEQEAEEMTEDPLEEIFQTK